MRVDVSDVAPPGCRPGRELLWSRIISWPGILRGRPLGQPS